MKVILGLNAYHADSSASIFIDNKLIASVEEERFNRIKHWSGFPVNSIKFCLNEAGVSINDVTDITINSNPYSNLQKKITYSLKKLNFYNFYKYINRAKKKFLIEKDVLKHFGRGSYDIHRVDHHLSHIWSGFAPSGFSNCLCISVDGMGDFCSIVVAECDKSKSQNIKILQKIYYPNSLGIFYEAITQYLGFRSYGDEYKMMGLSSFGEPIFKKKLLQLFHSDFELQNNFFNHTKNNFTYQFSGIPKQEFLLDESFFNSFFAPREKDQNIENHHINIAASAQSIFEDKLFKLIDKFSYLKQKNLVLVGGCAMNSVCNGKISMQKKFENIFIPAFAGDNGGSIGSSIYYLNKIGIKEFSNISNPYLGPSFDNFEIKKVINDNICSSKFEILDLENEDRMIQKVTDLLVDGNIIGWFQGKMEIGSRALGNRSIICDPRLQNARDLINTKIKFREKFRPFAPSIMEEYVLDWFVKKQLSPYMSFVIDFKEEKKKLVPAIVHVDGTGRLQTVSYKNNKLYYNLIKSFFKKTDVPIILNTSFNENEPIVCKPIEAINTFLRTSMDVLVMNNYVVVRK